MFQINDRAKALLKDLIEHYIREGQPVGSTTLAQQSRLNLSSATVRNVIADLEKSGLVRSTHTSSGRVPTELGYRLFIDDLLTVKQPKDSEIRQLQDNFEQQSDTKTLAESASVLLSGVTQLAGVVMLPSPDQSSLKQIEFVRLSESKVLAILVYADNEVQNKIVTTERSYSADELQRIANFLNMEFMGADISTVRKNLLKSMKETKDSMNQIMINAIEMANKVFEDGRSQDCMIAGETNLMGYQEMADVTRLQHLFEVFNEKQVILQLLDQSVRAQGIQIFIGSESGYDELQECSIVTATYSANDQTIGALGVIGPTRMAYDRVIPIVDVAARLLGNMINNREQ